MREGRKEKEQGEGVGEGGREDRTGEEIKQATMKTLMPVAAAIKKDLFLVSLLSLLAKTKCSICSHRLNV